jgi:hypothetical protein
VNIIEFFKKLFKFDTSNEITIGELSSVDDIKRIENDEKEKDCIEINN